TSSTSNERVEARPLNIASILVAGTRPLRDSRPCQFRCQGIIEIRAQSNACSEVSDLQLFDSERPPQVTSMTFQSVELSVLIERSENRRPPAMRRLDIIKLRTVIVSIHKPRPLSQMRPGNPHVPSAKYRPRPELAAPLPRRTDLEINSTSPQQKEKGHHNPANPRNIARREKDEHRENPDPGEGAKRQTSFPLRDHDSRLQPILRIPDLKNSGAAITAPMRHPTAIDNQGL